MPAWLTSRDNAPPIPVTRKGIIVIGRDSDCDVRIESQYVSRHHCCLSESNEGLVIEDLESRNGTFLNGQRISSAVLRSGDEIAIAHVRYIVDLGDLNSGDDPDTDLTAEMDQFDPKG